MDNTLQENTSNANAHSENYFQDYRNFWWNDDFLDLMAKRLHLSQYHSLLDVGCGQCHWSKLLAGHLAKPAKIYAIDQDPKWAAGSPELSAYFKERNMEFHLKQGDAHYIPYPDNSFDLVTCQTVLIHVKYPGLVISEMQRVLKPGGMILCVEPNNLIQNLTRSSLSSKDSIEDTLDHVKYALICEGGKKKLGQGDSSIGDLVPGLLAEAGFQGIESWLSDKTIPMFPPYTSKEQQATLQQWESGNSWQLDETGDLSFFKAYGERYLDFYEKYQAKYASSGQRFVNSLENEQYHSAGAAMMHIVSGIKEQE